MHASDDTAPRRCRLSGEAATLAFGARLSAGVVPGMTFYLQGDLGAGKTTLVRGMLRGLAYPGRVKSPTYTLVEIYNLAAFDLYHFDLYRMHDPREWLDAGFRDIGERAVSVIEWPEKAAGWLPAPDVVLRLVILDEAREIECVARSSQGRQYLERCCAPC